MFLDSWRRFQTFIGKCAGIRGGGFPNRLRKNALRLVRLYLEHLEDRVVPTTLNVTGQIAWPEGPQAVNSYQFDASAGALVQVNCTPIPSHLSDSVDRFSRFYSLPRFQTVAQVAAPGGSAEELGTMNAHLTFASPLSEIADGGEATASVHYDFSPRGGSVTEEVSASAYADFSSAYSNPQVSSYLSFDSGNIPCTVRFSGSSFRSTEGSIWVADLQSIGLPGATNLPDLRSTGRPDSGGSTNYIFTDYILPPTPSTSGIGVDAAIGVSCLAVATGADFGDASIPSDSEAASLSLQWSVIDLNPYVGLFDPDGMLVATGSTALNYLATKTGTYTLKVTDFGTDFDGNANVASAINTTGAYQLTIAADIPDIVIEPTSLTWHEQLHDFQADSGGGVDLPYEIKYAPLPTNTPIEFYWADGPDFTGASHKKLAATRDLETSVGTHYIHVDATDLSMPESWTRYVLAVANRDHAVVEADYTNNEAHLGSSPDEILAGSVTFKPVGAKMIGIFMPARGALRIDQAAAICDVDNFNWLQTDTLHAKRVVKQVILRDIDDPKTNPIGILNQNGDLVQKNGLSGSQVPVRTDPNPPGSLDPVVQDGGKPDCLGTYWKDDAGKLHLVITWKGQADSDNLPFYWNVPDEVNALTDAFHLGFKDIPHMSPAYFLPGDYLSFTTRLIGEKDGLKKELPKAGFIWKSNAVLKNGTLDGFVYDDAKLKEVDDSIVPVIASGGVFDIQPLNENSEVPTSLNITSDHSGGSTYGQMVTFTATVNANDSTTPPPTGSVQFQIDGSNYRTEVSLSSGTVSITTPTLSAGQHQIVAFYTSDSSSFRDSDDSANPWSQTVNPAPLTITADNQTITSGYGLPALTATYAGVVNGDTPATFNLSPNQAPTLSTVPAASSPGTYAIAVAAASDPNYNITFVSGSLTINPAPLTISRSGFTYNNTKKQFVQTLTFTNIGPDTYTGTLALELINLTSGVTLANASGQASDGNPYITLPISTSQPLKAGQSFKLTLYFSDPTKIAINYGTLLDDLA